MVERFNGRISDVLRTHRFRSGQDMRQTLERYVHLYNHQLPQSALHSKTPWQSMNEWYDQKPELFHRKPTPNHPGCDNYLSDPLPQRRGRHTVRGFDGEVVLSAERGWLVRNEVSTVLRQDVVGYVGADYGQVGGSTSKWLVGRRLAGAVLGARGVLGGVGYDVSVGGLLYKPRDFGASGAVVDFTLSCEF
jgi:hypothetical protein